RVELELAAVWIAVGPEPLLAGRLHREVGCRYVQLQEQELERGNRDRHQDHDRDHRPDDLDQRIVGGARWGRIAAGVEPNDDDQQEDEDEAGDRRDGVEQIGVEFDNLVHYRRGRLLEIELPLRRPPVARPDRAKARKQGTDRDRRGGQPLQSEHRRHHSIDEAVSRRAVASRGSRTTPPGRIVRQGAFRQGARRDFWGIPASQNHNSGLLAMHLVMASMSLRAARSTGRRLRFPPPLSRPQCLVSYPPFTRSRDRDRSGRAWGHQVGGLACREAGEWSARGGFRELEATMGSFSPALLRRAAAGTLLALALTLTAGAEQAAAQGTVRSVHNDWQIRCDTPPGAQGEQCAL